MILNCKYNIGDVVYVVTDKEQSARQITGITFRQTGVIYELTSGTTISHHYEFEISEEIDVLKSINER